MQFTNKTDYTFHILFFKLSENDQEKNILKSHYDIATNRFRGNSLITSKHET